MEFSCKEPENKGFLMETVTGTFVPLLSHTFGFQISINEPVRTIQFRDETKKNTCWKNISEPTKDLMYETYFEVLLILPSHQS